MVPVGEKVSDKASLDCQDEGDFRNEVVSNVWS